jgi:hypothetical protein
MAATFNESQKIDYLWKKVGYGVTKTAEPTSKEAFNESIASPLLYRGDLIWTQSGDIPATPPAATTALVQVYKDGVGSYSPAVQCTEDLTAPDNQTWKTNSTNWSPTQFGDNYLVQVYAGAANISNPQTAGTKLFGAGSGSDDTWFFDYQSGVLNFNGATIPTAIGTGTANTIYIVGYRYVGEFGVDTTFIGNGASNVNIATANANVTISVNGTSNVAVFSNTGAYLTGLLSASGNVTGNYILGNGSFLTGVVASSANAGDLTGNTLSSNVFYSNLIQVGNLTSLSVVGNTSSGNISVTGFVSATGNVYGNAILSDNYFYANGQPIPTGIVYTANTLTAGATYSWVREVVAGISQARNIGTNPAITEVLTNTTTSQKPVIYQITMTANGCSKTENVTVLVNPTPTVTVGLSNNAICSGGSSTVTATPGFGVTSDYDFFWTVPNGVANPGNVASFTAISTGTYLVSIKNKTTSCESVNASATLTVNSLPTLSSSLTPSAICSAGNFLYTPTSATANVAFSWTRATVVGITQAGTTGVGNVNETLTSSSTNPLTVRYVYTLVNNNTLCTNTQNVDVVVYAKPVLNVIAVPSICSGSTFSYAPTSNQDPNVDFTWTRAVVVGISNAAVTTPRTGSPEEILLNTSLSDVTVSYIYTLTNRVTGCTSTATVSVSVKPVPFLVSKPDASICSGEPVNYPINSSLVG